MRRHDAFVVGAGFAGLYAIHSLASAGFDVHGSEAGDDLGGAWYWNRYPGARCDIQSQIYSYLFDSERATSCKWRERYSAQSEIRHYLSRTAEELSIRNRLTFGCRISSLTFDEESSTWQIVADDGRSWTANFVFMATGALSAPQLPTFPRVEDYTGRIVHTADWPNNLNLESLSVGVIGTGSSGVQAIPELAKIAARLTVFQRTPAYVAPARNQELTPFEIERFKTDFYRLREKARRGEIVGAGDLIIADHLVDTLPSAMAVTEAERRALYEARWQVGGLAIAATFADLISNQESNETLAEFFRGKIAEIVKNQETRRKLTPLGFPIFSKRVCVGTDYYETYNRDNVQLVSLLEEPIVSFTKQGIATASKEYPLDVIVMATGFDALTGAISRIDISGKRENLRDYWKDRPRTFLGLGVCGFPNLFIINGPGSPGVLGNNVVGIEHHVEWLTELLTHARARGVVQIEVDHDAEAQWVKEVETVSKGSILSKGSGWYLKRHREDAPPVFVPYAGGLARYRDICSSVAADGYRGFNLW